MNRSETQRKAAIAHTSQEAQHRTAAEARRKHYESLTLDPSANARAKREFAEISQRQAARPLPTAVLDDAEPGQRRAMHLVLADAPLADEAEEPDVTGYGFDKAVPQPVPQAQPAVRLSPATGEEANDDPSSAGRPVARSAAGEVRTKRTTNGQTVVGKRHKPAVHSDPDADEAQDHDEAPDVSGAHAAVPAQKPVGGMFVVQERPDREPPLREPRARAYLPDDMHGGWVGDEYAPPRVPYLLICAVVAIMSILVIRWLWQSPQVSIYAGKLGLPFSQSSNAGGGPAAAPAEDQPGAHSVVGPATVTSEQINAVLDDWGSPARGTGEIWMKMGERYGLDPAYALAFFIHESGAGTNPLWDGLKPDGTTTHNIGNISCAGYPRCLGRWRDYGSWEEGIEDWFRLIRDEYVQGRGTSTVEQIMPIYAPSIENNVDLYVKTVVDLVREWRQESVQQ